jgi:outer membrane immunogenic protein
MNFFEKSLLVALLFASPICATSAADLSRKAPAYTPPASVPATWTGYYFGVNAGGVWANTDIDWSLNPVGFGPAGVLVEQAASGRLKTSGFTGGGQIGLNKQFDALVFGLEADLQYTDLSGTRTGGVIVPPGLFDSFTQSVESNWLGTLRGRLGVAFGSWLPYATGGLAVARVSYTDFGVFPFLPSTNSASSTETRVGWTLGGGVEWKFAPSWSIKAEYLYVDLGSTTYTSLNSVVGASASIIHNHHLTENIARVGLNYSFWSGLN